MPRDRLLRVLAVLVLGITALHIGAIVFYLYWTFWWYDMFVHLLGGAFAALLVLWLLFFSGYVRQRAAPNTFRVFCVALFSALFLGVGWEIFERVLGHTWSIEGYWLDTIGDIAFDAAGGLLGFFVFGRFIPGSIQTNP